MSGVIEGAPVLMTDERRMIQESAREFAMKEVLPLANRLDPERGTMPTELVDKMAEMGYFGITIPAKYGGLGLGAFEYCLVAEELSRAWLSVGSLLARGNDTFGSRFMSQEHREELLPRIARGEMLGAYALSEPGVGSDLAGMRCRARRDADGWRITGNKYWCTFADGADYLLVFARTSEPLAGKPYSGISALMVEKPRGQLPEGVSGHPIPKIGYFGWKTWELAFQDCFVPANRLIGDEGRGFQMMTSGLEVARAHTAARSIGLARGALEDSIRYAQEREQFGKPIGEFQAIRFKIAQMASEVEAARQLMYHVCSQIDLGARCDREAAMVKWFASEMAERVTSEGLQIHGGAGYTTHFAVERHWRDARLTKIFEGTSEIQLRLISDSLLGKPKS